MPPRTTSFQAIVHLVRSLTASPDVTVTESKMLLDSVLGEEREVDIVIAGQLDGESIVVSIEVIEKSRPGDLPWVEGMIKKHENLPTNRLILVSKSGFTKRARRAIAASSRVEAMVPTTVAGADGPVTSLSIFADSTQYTPREYWVSILETPTSGWEGQVAGELVVFGPDRQPLGTISQLGKQILNIPWLKNHLMWSAHHHEQRDELKSFQVRIPLPEGAYFLNVQESGDVHGIRTIETRGDFAFMQTEMSFAETELGGRRFGAGHGPMLGAPGVWVRTVDEVANRATIAWRTLSEPHPLATGSEIEKFKELLELPEPEGWDSPSRQMQALNIPTQTTTPTP